MKSQNDEPKLSILDKVLIVAKAVVYAIKETSDKKSALITRGMVSTMMPLARGAWKLDKPILPISKPVETEISEVKVEVGGDGTFIRITKGGKDITSQFIGGMPKDERFKGQTLTTFMIDKGGEDIYILPPDHKDVEKYRDELEAKRSAAKPEEAKASPAQPGLVQKVVAKTGTALLRPLKFKDRPLIDEDMGSDGTVLEEKIDGVSIEMDIPKNGIVTDVRAARAGKVNMIHGLPKIRDHVFDESVRDSKVWMEAKHPKGLHSTAGLLQTTRENAAIFTAKNGHPDVYVLGVLRNGGRDTSALQYNEQRALRELVATKIPNGKVPAKCDGAAAEKVAFRDKLFKAAKEPNPKVDGVVMLRKGDSFKGSQVIRSKPARDWDVVLRGFEPSKKISGAAGAFVYGDNRKDLGKVNIADPQMRVAVYQNSRRYDRKVANIGGLRRSSNGAVFQPRLKEIYWERNPASVPDWDPIAGLREYAKAVEPTSPAKQQEVLDTILGKKPNHGQAKASAA